MLKTIIGKLKRKDNNVDADIAQLKCNNNKYYASAFIYIYIYRYRWFDVSSLKEPFLSKESSQNHLI